MKVVYIVDNLKRVYAIVILTHLTLFIIDFGTTAFYFIKLEDFIEGNYFYRLGFSIEMATFFSGLVMVAMYCFIYFLNRKTENHYIELLLTLPASSIFALSINFSSHILDMFSLGITLLSALGVMLFSVVNTGISTSILFYYLRRDGCISTRRERSEDGLL